MMSISRARVKAGVLVAVLVVGCSADGADSGAPRGAADDGDASGSSPAEPIAPFVTSVPPEPVTVVPASDDAQAALATSRALFDAAPVVVLTPAGPGAEQHHDDAVDEATVRGAPLLVAGGDPAALAAELTRLGSDAVLVPGAESAAEVPDAVEALGVDVVTDPADLPETRPAAALTDVLVLTDAAPWAAPAVGSALAAGAQVRIVRSGDPRADPDTIAALAGRAPAHVLALGETFGDAETVWARVATASSGVELPGGGQVAFPHRRLVALYGHPGTPSMGVLGEQPVDEAVERALATAAEFEDGSGVPVVPAFEIIATVASSAPGPDGDYSAEASIESIRPWVDAAREAGLYVLLDLQPGRTDFLTQAKRYADLLAEPHVGLALDPEWRLAPGQVHLEQIGSVDVEEVNAVAAWLADLARARALPQKVLVLHQFRPSMIRGRERLDTSRDELAVVIHADGNGTPAEKLATWQRLHAAPPAGVHWAWKNFYDEDRPMFTPAQTLDLVPKPVLVTYQ
jgi:hypothetical protein